jgi:hypothetical protein
MTNTTNSSAQKISPINGFQPCFSQPYIVPTKTSKNRINSENIHEENWAFLDIQNLYQGIKERGWQINWPAFRRHLSEKYHVVKAVVFVGFVRRYQWLYEQLQQAGFTLEFREEKELENGLIDGGNVDADLASYVMDYKNEYHKAVIIADDGDYCRTILSLQRQNKLKLIISSHLLGNTSSLIKQSVNRDMLISIHGLRNQIAHTKFITD